MIRIEITRKGLLTIGRRGFQAIGRQAIEEAVHYWWSKYLPLHFKNVAYLRYGYERRDNRTAKLKLNKQPWPFGDDETAAIGEDVPLVFTGRSRERALSAPNIHAVAPNYQTYEGRAIIHAPAFNFGAGKRIDMRAEVTKLHPTEESKLQKVFQSAWNRLAIAAGLSAPRKTRKTAA